MTMDRWCLSDDDGQLTCVSQVTAQFSLTDNNGRWRLMDSDGQLCLTADDKQLCLTGDGQV